MPKNSNKKWTDSEDRQLLELRAASKSFVVIAAALKRSAAAVEGRYWILNSRLASRPPELDRKET